MSSSRRGPASVGVSKQEQNPTGPPLGQRQAGAVLRPPQDGQNLLGRVGAIAQAAPLDGEEGFGVGRDRPGGTDGDPRVCGAHGISI